MLKTRFFSRLFWLFVAVATTIVLAIAFRTGIFGEPAKTIADGLLEPLLRFYNADREVVDKAAVVIVTLATFFTGLVGLVKGFYYADMNLSSRLQEMVNNAQQMHAHERPELLAYVAGDFDTRDFLEPNSFANPIAAALRVFGIESLRTRARDVASDVDRLDGELQALASASEHARNRKVTGHLLRAGCYARDALRFPAATLDHEAKLTSALHEYEAALALRPDDLDALEGAAQQCDALKNYQDQRRYLDRLIAACQAQVETLRGARALRLSAGLIYESTNADDNRTARRNLEQAIATLNEAKPEERRELVEALILYGVIQGKRMRIPTARKAFTRASALAGPDQKVRANDALRQLGSIEASTSEAKKGV